MSFGAIFISSQGLWAVLSIVFYDSLAHLYEGGGSWSPPPHIFGGKVKKFFAKMLNECISF